ncbi:calcium:proton antiporter [Dyadobacter chenhuakuii]|uniref:Ionic transporter y4hA n=1 Tax=Dyadobacter chenhuakuii TaxID=2909339 RepID=A0ABY4XQ77_9BACT|nr:ionic transporter y4hA [Dyadobacter chenhuakuii]MCF2493116.1 ionic transporter y4hA [Dyadobacter chenhuakuii]USJ32599.1 ionic transporter y4hA [Dyadobacter chenhuakuii]
MKSKLSLPRWSIITPVLAWLLYYGKSFEFGSVYDVFLAFGLIGVVLAAVHHAEVIAHRVGEPAGTLVLAIAITIIEVALIVSLMLAGGAETAALARDTVFAAIMIILTGIIGLCLLVGGYRYQEQQFGKFGVSAALVTLTAISVLTLVLPNYTTSVIGPVYNNSQLIFVAIISLVLYGTFVMVQTVRHRAYFLPEIDANKETPADPPSNQVTLISTVLLLVCLAAVVLLAKMLAPTIETFVVEMGAPKSLVGVIVAAVILLPEGLAALRAAKKNRLQISLNLALGSALASIGLTIPVVAVVSIFTGLTITLGIDTKSTLLLILSLFTVALSFGTGKTTVMQGVVLLVIFAVYLFTTIVP